MAPTGFDSTDGNYKEFGETINFFPGHFEFDEQESLRDFNSQSNGTIPFFSLGAVLGIILILIICKKLHLCPCFEPNHEVTYTREISRHPQNEGQRSQPNVRVIVAEIRAPTLSSAPSQSPSSGDIAPPPFEHPPSYTEAILHNGNVVKFPEKVC